MSRIASTSILRSALAAHAGLSATSLLRSALGPPSMPPSSSSSSSSSSVAAAAATPDGDDPPRRRRRHSRPRPDPHRPGAGGESTAGARAALPWLDRLHAVVADLYASGGGGGGTDDRGRAGGGRTATEGGLLRSGDADADVATVRLGRDVSFEDPIVRHAGDAEVGRAFRCRLRSRPFRDVETVLECVGVEASDDGICGGGGVRDVGIISPDPPRVVVTYRLSQRYGPSRLTVDSLLLVTVQVRSRGCSERLRRIKHDGKVGVVPLATSGLAPRAASTAAAAAHPGVAALALLARAANDMVAAAAAATTTTKTTTGGAPHRRPDDDGRLARRGSTPLVAEVVGMEERWNGVGLIDFAPVRWSRRLNGLIFGCASYIFCD